MKLSEHFTLEELVFSQTAARKGIDNAPSITIVSNLRILAAKLDEIRGILGVPLLISSGYRCGALNRAVGGTAASAHIAGLAADFTAPGFGSVLEVARAISASDIAYDQLIYEFGAWVHLGLGPEPLRRQDLSIFRGSDYFAGIWPGPTD
jgi:zinc D-Ala-D-Ala carboxypeptidase